MKVDTLETKLPPKLRSHLVDHLAGLQKVVISYKAGPVAYRDFAVLGLENADGKPPKVDETPTDDADAIAQKVMQLSREHAEQHGRNWYGVELKLSKARNGKVRPGPKRIVFQLDPDGDSTPAVGELTAEGQAHELLRLIASDARKQTNDLTKEVTKLVGALGGVGSVLGAAADMFKAGMYLQRDANDQTLTHKLAELQAETEVKKWGAVAEHLGPGAKLLWKQIEATIRGRTPGAPQSIMPNTTDTEAKPAPPKPIRPKLTASSTETGDTSSAEKNADDAQADDVSVLELLRRFNDALTDEQRKALPDNDATTKLLALVNPDTPDDEQPTDAQVTAAVHAWVEAASLSELATMYGELTSDQVQALEALQRATGL